VPNARFLIINLLKGHCEKVMGSVAVSAGYKTVALQLFKMMFRRKSYY
jgi:hypothetical protein